MVVIYQDKRNKMLNLRIGGIISSIGWGLGDLTDRFPVFKPGLEFGEKIHIGMRQE